MMQVPHLRPVIDAEQYQLDGVIHLMQSDQAEPKPKTRQRGRQTAPKRDKIRAIVRPLLEAGQSPNVADLAQELGVARETIREALALERGRLEGLREVAQVAPPEPIDLSVLTASQRERFEILERRVRAQLEREHNDRLTAEVTRHIKETLMPIYGGKLATAEKLMKRGRPFTHAEFRDVLGACHPDCVDPERRLRAFNLLKEKEVVLRPEEKDRPLTSDLPSKDELQARMRASKR